jgi:hypothetical protein
MQIFCNLIIIMIYSKIMFFSFRFFYDINLSFNIIMIITKSYFHVNHDVPKQKSFFFQIILQN